MTREIKFRCWNTSAKAMYPLEHFALTMEGKELQLMQKCEHYDKPYLLNNAGSMIYMQYTGLKDKNLCQADIIEYPFEHPITGEVDIFKGVIEKDEYGFIVETLDGSSSFPLRQLDEVINEVKVIGNRLENPELLKQ